MRFKFTIALFLVFVFLFFIPESSGQNVILRVKGTYNSFSMINEKDIQNELFQGVKKELPSAVIADEFPASYGVQFQGFIIDKKHFEQEVLLGAFFDIASATGRITFNDNSLGISLEQLIKIYSYGPIVEVIFPGSDIFSFTTSIAVPMMNGSMTVSSKSTTGSHSNGSSYEFTTFAVGLQPGVGIIYKNERVHVILSADFLVPFSSTYCLDGDEDKKLVNSKGQYAKPGYSGARLSIGGGISF